MPVMKLPIIKKGAWPISIILVKIIIWDNSWLFKPGAIILAMGSVKAIRKADTRERATILIFIVEAATRQATFSEFLVNSFVNTGIKAVDNAPMIRSSNIMVGRRKAAR